MVSNEFITSAFPLGGHDGRTLAPGLGGNRTSVPVRFMITIAIVIIVGALKSPALGQSPGASIAEGDSPQAAAPYPPPAYGSNTPMPDQNAAVQGADTRQPSEEPLRGGGFQRYQGPYPVQAPAAAPPPQPEEKKEGEKSDKDGKKDVGKKVEDTGPQNFNFHAQTTVTAQGDPGFPAQYSGPNSLNNVGERQNTVVADLFAGVLVWRGGEVHGDFMMWEGYGLSQTFGIEDFPNADAYKAGTTVPNFMAAHLFFRQTFGLGGEQEDVPDSPFTLRGKQDISRLTIYVGRLTPTDMFDNNTYAKDAHTQFLNWANATNITWDYASDQVGFTTGIAVEYNQPDWTLRGGFFQMPGVQNGFTPTTGSSAGPAAEATARSSKPGK